MKREQSIGALERHPWGIQDVVDLKIIPRISLELLRDDPAFEYRVHDPASRILQPSMNSVFKLGVTRRVRRMRPKNIRRLSIR